MAERVYFVHGLLGTAELHFGAAIAALRDEAGADLDIVAIDLPGHGDCLVDARDPFLDEVFRYLVATMRAHGPGHVIALSYLGGPVAVRCAREHPELVRSLVLTGFGVGMPRSAFAAMQDAYLLLVDQDPALPADYLRMHGARWRDTLETYCAHVVRAFDEVFLVQPEVIGALDVDVLLLNGSDKSLERNAATAAASYGPRVRGVVLDGAGHIPTQDMPERFVAVVREFWAGLR